MMGGTKDGRERSNSRLSLIQSLFFLTLPLFSLFLQLIPYFILLNDCDKEQKKGEPGNEASLYLLLRHIYPAV